MKQKCLQHVKRTIHHRDEKYAKWSYLHNKIAVVQSLHTTFANYIWDIILPEIHRHLNINTHYYPVNNDHKIGLFKNLRNWRVSKYEQIIWWHYQFRLTSFSAKPYNAKAALCCKEPFLESRSSSNGFNPPSCTIPAWLWVFCEDYKHNC